MLAHALRSFALLFAVVATLVFGMDAMGAIVIQPTAATASTSFTGRVPINTINDSGLSAALPTGTPEPGVWPTHTNVTDPNMWHTNGVYTGQITYDLGSTYALNGFHVWNFNENSGNPALFTLRGMRNVQVSYSTTGVGGPFTVLTTYSGASEFAQAPGTNTYTGETKSLPGVVVADAIRFDVLTPADRWGGTNGDPYTGLSEVRFLGFGPGTLGATPTNGSTIEVPGLVEGGTVTMTDAIVLENTAAVDTVIDIQSFSISGPDAANFDLSDFAPQMLFGGDDVAFDIEFSALTGDQEFNAVLTIVTSAGNVTYDLHVSQVPEPTAAASLMLGSAGLAFVVRRRRRSTESTKV